MFVFAEIKAVKALAFFIVAFFLTLPVAVLGANEVVWVLTDDQHLVRVNADKPQESQLRLPIKGLEPGHALVGIDFRVSRGVMFALSDHAQLYTVDTASGRVKPVGDVAKGLSLPLGLLGHQYGFDFNPAADRIRVVNERRQNLRLHPETGALVSTDPNLVYAPTDDHVGEAPRIGAAAYTYNSKDEKLTTNFAIDLNLGTLAVQGTRETVLPAVSPNQGVLFTVGPLGQGPLVSASFDIADVSNRALGALRPLNRNVTGLYDIDLETGKARLIGQLLNGKSVRGIAIEP